MDLAERYQTEAQHCLREAASVTDRRRKAGWQALAQRWLELAEHLNATPVDRPKAPHHRTASRIGHRHAAAKRALLAK
jgi:hypothetical protein